LRDNRFSIMKNKKITILLAEDDEFIARAYQDGLRRDGFEVLVAPDGQDAMEQIRRKKPDIILLDLIMPVKNGFEVLEDIQLEKELKSIPVIILSNLGQEADIEKGKSMGATDYLVKSDYSMKDVIAKVRECLAGTRAATQQ